MAWKWKFAKENNEEMGWLHGRSRQQGERRKKMKIFGKIPIKSTLIYFFTYGPKVWAKPNKNPTLLNQFFLHQILILLIT